MPEKKQNLLFAAIGVAAAIAITTTLDATGLTAFSALPLFGITLVMWAIQKVSRRELGLQISQPIHYGIALLYPLVVMSTIAAVALFAGAIDTSEANWSNTALNILVGGPIGVIMVLITEELFFRGWLWATLKRAGLSNLQVLIWTSVIFMTWHISWVTLTDAALPMPQIFVYLVNAFLLGAIWGAMRLISDSVIVASVSHAFWNVFAYSLFGFGTRIGDLGVQPTIVYGPEVGWLGIMLNLCFLVAIWKIFAGNSAHRKFGHPAEKVVK